MPVSWHSARTLTVSGGTNPTCSDGAVKRGIDSKPANCCSSGSAVAALRYQTDNISLRPEGNTSRTYFSKKALFPLTLVSSFPPKCSDPRIHVRLTSVSNAYLDNKHHLKWQQKRIAMLLWQPKGTMSGKVQKAKEHRRLNFDIGTQFTFVDALYFTVAALPMLSCFSKTATFH